MTELILAAIVLVPFLVVFFFWFKLRSSYLKTTTNELIKDRVVLSVAVPRNNEKSPLAAEQLYASIHGIGLNKTKSPDHFSLEIAAGSYGIFFIVVVDSKYKTFFENQLYAQYPEAQISQINDYTNSLTKTPGVIQIAELTLAKKSYLPIRTFQNFDVDPLAGITGSISKLPPGHEVFIQMVARPVNDDWHKAGKDYVNQLKSGGDSEEKKGLESGDKEIISIIENKNTKVGFQFILRIMAKSPDQITSGRLIQEATASFSQYRTAIFNSLDAPKIEKGIWVNISGWFRKTFIGSRLGEKIPMLEKYRNRYLDEHTGAIISTEEFASLYHLPNKSVETPNIAWSRSKKLEYPLNIPTGKGSRMLAMTDYRGVEIRYGIDPEDRLRHMYVIGKTGVGKSKFLEGTILADIYEGNGVGFMDPHGDSIQYILDRIPPHRVKDVVLFDPGDTEYPIAFNLLETKEGEDKSLIADGIVTVFKKQFANSWGPRLEYILSNAILTLLHAQNISLLVLPRMLTDDNYRKYILKQLKDPILLKFWESEYEPLARDARRRDAEIASIMNKVGRFTTNPMIRNIIGQVSSSMNIKEIMDNKKILLINLSQGKVGEENMALLGGMIITRMYSSITQRVGQKERTPFYLFVDEFQNFSTSTFEKILSEARKYGLSLTVAHQFIDQLEEGIQNAIFGNIGTIVNFAIGPRDAEVLVKQYTPYLEAEDLVNLGRQKIVNKLSVDLAQSKPFTATTLTHNFPITNMNEEILSLSRKKYASHKSIIEKKLYKWSEQIYSKTGNVMSEAEMAAEKERLSKKESKRQYKKEFGKGPAKPSYSKSPQGSSSYNNNGPRTSPSPARPRSSSSTRPAGSKVAPRSSQPRAPKRPEGAVKRATATAPSTDKPQPSNN